MIEVLNNIPVAFDAEQVLKLLRIRHRSDSIVRMVYDLIEQAAPVVRPKAMHAV